MTQKDRKALGNYLRDVADEMELRDWYLTLAPDGSCDDDAWAMCWPTDGKRHANIGVCDNFRELDPETQRETVVHELIHCHLAMAQNQVRHDLEPHLAAATDKAFFDAFNRNIEYAVDGLAKALAPRFPMIEWPA